MSGVFVGGDVPAMLAVARRLGADEQETASDAGRLAAGVSGIALDITKAGALSPVGAARVVARAAGCEAGLLALAAACAAASQLLAQHCHLLEEAAVAGVVAGGILRTVRRGPPAAIPVPADLTEVHAEELSGAAGLGYAGTQGSLRIAESVAPDGRHVWVVSRRQDAAAGVDAGSAVNGIGARVEASRGSGVTAVWAFASLDDAKAAVALSLTAVATTTLGMPSTLVQHRTISAAVAAPMAGGGVSFEASREAGRDGSTALEVSASAGGLALLPLPASLPGAPSNAAAAVRFEAPADPAQARLVVTIETDEAVPSGTGVSALDAGNREVRRTTRVATVELTDADDVAAARRLACHDLDQLTAADLAEARHLVDGVDLGEASFEEHGSVGVVQHADAGVAVGLGASGGASIEVWETTG